MKKILFILGLVMMIGLVSATLTISEVKDRLSSCKECNITKINNQGKTVEITIEHPKIEPITLTFLQKEVFNNMSISSLMTYKEYIENEGLLAIEQHIIERRIMDKEIYLGLSRGDPLYSLKKAELILDRLIFLSTELCKTKPTLSIC